MKTHGLLAAALIIASIAAALVVAGCSGASGTPTPAPSITPAASLTPVEKEYQYVEQLYLGTDDYNTGIAFVNMARDLANQSDYTNASRYTKMASDRFAVAKGDFEGLLPYASTPQEVNLSLKWTESMDYFVKDYQNASDAYAELAYQAGRPNPNYVKSNYYMQQADYYNALANEARRQAEAIENNMTFVAPTPTS